MKRLIVIGVLLTVLSACTSEKQDMKSPCVGAEGSPCARRPVNTWLPAADQV
jgi:hypothetical protein